MIEIQLGDVGKTIQLAIAPVFLLTGVCTNLIVLTNRLARIIDRSRSLEESYHTVSEQVQLERRAELESLYIRAHLINRAVTLSTSCALLVCLVIASLFVGDALHLTLAKVIAAFFVIAMLALIGSFVYLLREIFIATRTLSMRSFISKQ
ncbi:DUF2721 domain-containing protein [soil metagenome]